MFDSLTRSWNLTKESWNVLMQDKELMLFPVISSVLSIVVFLSFFIPIALLYKNHNAAQLESYLGLIILFVFYFITNFIIVFSNTAILHCASIRFKGGDPVFMDGIRAGMENFGRIALWALLSGTVGIILAQIEERLGELIGGLIRKLIGGAWAVITFFAVPVMIFEKTSPIEAIKKSVSIIKKTWGESLAAYIGVGAVSGWLAMIGFFFLMAFIVLGFVLHTMIIAAVGAGIVVLYWITLGIVFASLTQIYRAALYEYATTGAVPTVFSEQNIRDAFRKKEGGKFI
jgi:hypothetical protein